MSRAALLAVAFLLLLIQGTGASAQPPAASAPAADNSCSEDSCEREFAFLYVDPSGNGGLGQVTLRVERSIKLAKVPVMGFYEEYYGGLGDQWRASAWLAATYAALHGYDVARRITYSVSQPIQGPSASAALTVALLAALRRAPTKPGVVMTGTINPDGTIGPVAGIPAKIEAAVQYGKEVLLIPHGQLTDEILTRVGDVNGKRQAEKQPPFQVKEIQNIAQAYKEFTGLPLSTKPGPDLFTAAQLQPGALATAMRQRLDTRIQQAESVIAFWTAEQGLNPPQNAIDLASEGAAALARAKSYAAREPATAHREALNALDSMVAAVSCARDARNNRDAVFVGDANEGHQAIDRVLKAFNTLPGSPTELSVLAELGGMVQLYKQYTIRRDRARAAFTEARMGSDATAPAADVSNARLAYYAAEAQAVGMGRRIADYLNVWRAVQGQITGPGRTVSNEVVSRLVRMLSTATEANLGSFEAYYGCGTDGTAKSCATDQMIVGYRELREMRNSLRLALSDPALTPASERGFLAVALEAYLWSSVLIHPSYRSLLTKGEGGTASSTAGGPTADPAALLDFAKREAAETVETLDADAGSPRALLPRIYIQMGNRLSTSSHIADQLQALQFFWRASTHGRLILAIDGLQPTPR